MTGLVLRQPELYEISLLAEALRDSGYFDGVQTTQQAVVKIVAGREVGLGPVEAMRSFHVIGKAIEPTSDLLARMVRRHLRYDYRVLSLADDGCELAFYEIEDGERVEVGRSTFTEADRERAELSLRTNRGEPSSWARYPRNMMFARAMSNGVGWYCPDVIDALSSAGGAAAEVPGSEAATVLPPSDPGPTPIVPAAEGEILTGAVPEVAGTTAPGSDDEAEGYGEGPEVESEEPVENHDDPAPEPDREGGSGADLVAEVVAPDPAPEIEHLPEDDDGMLEGPTMRDRAVDQRPELWAELEQATGRSHAGARSYLNVVHRTAFTGASEDQVTAEQLRQAIAHALEHHGALR